MVEYPVSGFPEYVDVRINCPKCGNLMEDRITIPAPDFLSEKDSFSGTRNDDFSSMTCQCGFFVGVQAIGSCSGNFIILEDVEDDDINLIEEHYNDDDNEWIDYKPNASYFQAFIDSMGEIKKLQQSVDVSPENASLLNNLLYSHLVTCLETFLSDALISNVFAHDVLFEKFIKSYHPYKEQKISLSNVLDTYRSIAKRVKKDLSNIVFHRLDKVNSIYESTFGFELPPFNEIGEITEIRHDLIHRNGKNKEGEIVSITPSDFSDAYEKIFKFVTDTNSEITKALASI